MHTQETPLGTVIVGECDRIFRKATELINALASDIETAGEKTIALTGGSTPKAFYKWASKWRTVSKDAAGKLAWFTSDERHVPFASDDNNFGNADRMLLENCRVPGPLKNPWPTDLPPGEAAEVFNMEWDHAYGEDTCFDLCFLGMGDDCHTASIFPGSPLLDGGSPLNFAAVEVPDKGWRLSITPAGLARCGHIVVMLTGAGKQAALHEVFNQPVDTAKRPIQLLADLKDKVTWLMDEAAGAAFLPKEEPAPEEEGDPADGDASADEVPADDPTEPTNEGSSV